ncbi:MAG: aminotransferase class V-fold PLP-dependent enzyme [Thermoanaerobaculia bacterium]
MARLFTSDNASGVHPEVLAALERANVGDAAAYGGDAVTARAVARVRRHFGEEAEVLFTFGGTGANVVALAAVTRPTDAVLCAASSHLWKDECAAPERFLAAKLLPIETADGRLDPESVRRHLVAERGVHQSRPRVLSITQATEWGTLYRAEEMAALAELAHAHDVLLHVDGARLANAAAALDVPLAALSRDVGADVVSFGGTKNGLLGAEAVLFLRPGLAHDAPRVRKQAMQLASKMRFLAVQIEALLTDDLWLRNAGRANAMAARLADRLAGVPTLDLAQPVETNAVFLRVAPDRLAALCAGTGLAVWDPESSIVRCVASFDTTQEEVDAFAERVRTALV